MGFYKKILALKEDKIRYKSLTSKGIAISEYRLNLASVQKKLKNT